MKIKTPPLSAPDVRCGHYAGPIGEGASENLWDSDSIAARDAQWLEMVGPVVEALSDACRFLDRNGFDAAMADKCRDALRNITEA